MSSTDLLGWDLLYKIVCKDFRNEADVLIALAHWFFIRNNFKCVGLGDDHTINPDDEGSELLPEGWNTDQHSYALRYMNNDNLYILHGMISDESIIMNLVQVKSMTVTNAMFHLKDTVKAIQGPLKDMVPSHQQLIQRYKKEILDPVFNSGKIETQTQTQSVSTISTTRPRPCVPTPDYDSDPLAIPPRIRNPLIVPSRSADPLRNVGRGDLDPFSGGGGMIFTPPGMPFRNPGLGGPAGGGIGPLPNVPGARYDPFGPPTGPERPQRTGPDNDHLPPPGYDDMFM